MKKYLSILLAGFMLAALLILPNTTDAAQRTVHVNNIYDMMEAVADDTEIVLAPGRYNISEWERGTAAQRIIQKMEYNTYSPAGIYGTYDITFAGFKNLTIRGRDTAAVTAEIVIEDPVSTVLPFKSCTNLTLANVSVGHIVKKGTCSGAVLEFIACANVDIKNADLFGCGTYGYVASDSRNINLYDSVIRECTYGLISARSSTDLRCLRSTFKDTKTQFNLFDLAHSQLSLEDCVFQNLRGEMSALHIKSAVQAANNRW